LFIKIVASLDLRITHFYNRPHRGGTDPRLKKRVLVQRQPRIEEVPMPVMKKRAKKATKSKPMQKSKMAKKKPAKKTKKK
jgi:hypothetical protein